MAIEFTTPDGPSDPITPLSAEPESVASMPASDTLECIVCGKALTYAGRGAKPKYCDEHKGGRSGTSRTPTASSGGRTTKDERMRRELLAMFGTISVGVMAYDVYDGMVVMDRSGATVDALMDLAQHNSQVRKVLEQMLEVSVWAAVATAVAGMALPIAANHGVAPLPLDMLERQFLSPETAERIKPMRRSERAKRRNAPPSPPVDDQSGSL